MWGKETKILNIRDRNNNGKYRYMRSDWRGEGKYYLYILLGRQEIQCFDVKGKMHCWNEHNSSSNSNGGVSLPILHVSAGLYPLSRQYLPQPLCLTHPSVLVRSKASKLPVGRNARHGTTLSLSLSLSLFLHAPRKDCDWRALWQVNEWVSGRGWIGLNTLR